MTKKSWFSTWFDSPYYHILYEQRDEQEAASFIQALQQKLHIQPGMRALDAACGKGRHAHTLHSLGLQVEAFDLSPANIDFAQKSAKPQLDFFVHDLRATLPKQEYYDVIFNFFTSFGYFDDRQDNQKAFQTFQGGLKKQGILLMDFLNPSFVLANLVPEERVERKGISFFIKRWEAQGYLYKSIEFSDQGHDFHFEEKVELISKTDFISYATKAGFELIDMKGNYQLVQFDEIYSPRMIFFWVKK
jgi:SAM-dependent methyltransferase